MVNKDVKEVKYAGLTQFGAFQSGFLAEQESDEDLFNYGIEHLILLIEGNRERARMKLHIGGVRKYGIFIHTSAWRLPKSSTTSWPDILGYENCEIGYRIARRHTSNSLHSCISPLLSSPRSAISGGSSRWEGTSQACSKPSTGLLLN